MWARANRPVDLASLAAFRIVFGVVMFVGLIRFLASGWIEPLYAEPTWFFKYPGFSWVAAWPIELMYVHYAALAALALLIAAGAWHRIVTPLFTFGFAYTQLVDVTNYLNHHVLVVLLGILMTCLPVHAMWSVDAWRDPTLERTTVPAWMVWLVRFQIAVVYVFAGLAKAKADWLLDGQPLATWLTARTETPIIGPWLDQPAVALAFSWAGFLFDTTIVLWLSWRRTRLPAFIVLIGFHALTGYFFNLGMFPFIMTSSALIFFSPSWPRRLWPRLGDRGTDPPQQHHRLPRFVAIAIGAFIVVQLVLPLRHLVYPGDVLWNEDGMRFAWHVMIREKHGSVMFVARFPDGRRLEIPPRRYLTWRQEREMAGQPDLIVQLARQIGRDLEAQGHHGVEIHADTRVSLNGRAPIPMIDPTIDLRTVRDVGSRDWVLPAPTEPARMVGTRVARGGR